MSSASKSLGAVLKGNVNIRIQLRAVLAKGVYCPGMHRRGGNAVSTKLFSRRSVAVCAVLHFCCMDCHQNWGIIEMHGEGMAKKL